MDAAKRVIEVSDDDLAELVGLARASDSVEPKLTVPEAHPRSTVVELGLDPLEAQIRQVYFFDTPDLALNEAALVVRARRVQGGGVDLSGEQQTKTRTALEYFSSHLTGDTPS